MLEFYRNVSSIEKKNIKFIKSLECYSRLYFKDESVNGALCDYLQSEIKDIYRNTKPIVDIKFTYDKNTLFILIKLHLNAKDDVIIITTKFRHEFEAFYQELTGKFNEK